MLALTSPVHRAAAAPTSSRALAPGVHLTHDLDLDLDLDLPVDVDHRLGMADFDAFLTSRPQDTATSRPMEGQPPFSLPRQAGSARAASAVAPSADGRTRLRFDAQSSAAYGSSAAARDDRISPDRPDHPERRHHGPALQLCGMFQGPVGTPRGEPFSQMPFGSATVTYAADRPANQQQHPGAPRLNHDEPGLGLRRRSQDSFALLAGSPTSQSHLDYDLEPQNRHGADVNRPSRYHTRRRPFNQDEFDGPSQLLPLPVPQQEHARSQTLTTLPVHLELEEQDELVLRINDILSRCAFHFVAKYQFPIPLERDKPRVRTPADREWTEWAYLLKRLATKRRIPARVLYDNQIKQFVTTLENSIAARPNNRDQQPRTPKDDRYVLQLISAGTQVAKILMDSLSMEHLDALYRQTESVILERRARVGGLVFQ